LTVKQQRRLRKLVPDGELIKRRAAGESLRDLAAAYGVAHTTLIRYFARAEVSKELREAGRQRRAAERALAARHSIDLRIEREVRRKAKEQIERERAWRVEAEAAARRLRPPRTSFEASLNERDTRVPFTRRDLHSQHDATAERVVAEGGGIQAVIDATDLRSHENVARSIDPEILVMAYDNDAIAGASTR
jgi:hypothetical protein